MKKHDKIIFKSLYESVEGLYAFTIFSRHRIEPQVLSDFIIRYREKGIINYGQDRISLTEEGKKILLNKKIVVNEQKALYDLNTFLFSGPRIEINKPYLPSIKKVSSEIHNIREDNDN